MPLIEIKEVNKIYKLGDIEVNALHNISLSIEKGEFAGIMGPSGSGKSTFLNIIGCLDRPTSGQYLIDGFNVSQLNRDQLSNIRNIKIGFIFQGFNLLPRTSAIENVELPMLYKGVSAKERKKIAIEALSAVGLEERKNHYPNQLSGGQQQRVAIARALVNKAPIILADEPTGNLDTKTSSEIMELFLKLNRESNISIIIVTHEPDIAAYCKRIIRFKDGNIISDERNEQN
ncbi:MAG: ABC transporter ATP-binding protein [Desulfobacterales bacterium]|nr:ABC transporter ATP-binding protein [Desulfobacterales bacterium]